MACKERNQWCQQSDGCYAGFVVGMCDHGEYCCQHYCAENDVDCLAEVKQKEGSGAVQMACKERNQWCQQSDGCYAGFVVGMCDYGEYCCQHYCAENDVECLTKLEKDDGSKTQI